MFVYNFWQDSECLGVQVMPIYMREFVLDLVTITKKHAIGNSVYVWSGGLDTRGLFLPDAAKCNTLSYTQLFTPSPSPPYLSLTPPSFHTQ